MNSNNLFIKFQIIVGLVTVGIIGALGYLIYFIFTQPAMVNEWFNKLIG